jgi:NTE family protein
MPQDPTPGEQNVLVLQGGGALGAYQAGAALALARRGILPDWIAGISIGALNAAILAGNPPERRAERLRGFWERITSGLPDILTPGPALSRTLATEISAGWVMTRGVPGFFAPRFPPPPFRPDGTPAALSWYDTTPLEATLHEFVDFDHLNDRGPRVSLGAVELGTANFDYFDSRDMRLDARHVMASGALPPGFPPIEIDGRLYWDGGLVSNTPLQHVLDQADGTPLCIFQMDLFPARGAPPRNILDVVEREKDIRYSSRTRLTTDRYRQLMQIQAAACRLRDKAGAALQDDPDLQFLCATGSSSPVMLVHLINRKDRHDGHAKDYEFSRLTMEGHWTAGRADVERALDAPEWRNRVPGAPGLTILDPGITGRRRHIRTDGA